MEITIAIPGMKCDKCSLVAFIQPSLLFKKSIPTPRSHRTWASSSTVDSRGEAWTVLSEDLPFQWTKGAHGNLCPECAALWIDAEKRFLNPPPPAPAPKPVAPVPIQPARYTARVTARTVARPMRRLRGQVAKPVVVAPKPVVQPKRKASPPPVILKPSFGSSVPPTLKIEPRKKPVGKVFFKPGPPKPTSTGGCTILPTAFGSSVPVPTPEQLRAIPKPKLVVAPVLPTCAGGIVLPKTAHGSTVPLPVITAPQGKGTAVFVEKPKPTAIVAPMWIPKLNHGSTVPMPVVMPAKVAAKR